MHKLTMEAGIETWPVAGSFRIAHGSIQSIDVVTVSLKDQYGNIGIGECRPYARYDETPTSVIAQIRQMWGQCGGMLDIASLQALLPAGAARNAADCALWNLKAARTNRPIWELAECARPAPRITAFTLSIDTPKNMAVAARAAAIYPILKIKIGGANGLAAAKAVMEARPDCELIIDANESLTLDELADFRSALANYPVLLIEQPIKAGKDQTISISEKTLPIFCADESAHTSTDLQNLWAAGYRAVNVKLDKTGGLTEALAMMRAAKSMGFLVMAGCMVGTSRAIAPMMQISALADFIDLDGPLLLARDVEPSMHYDGAQIYP